MKCNSLFIIAIALYECYGVNSETSEIGSMSPRCLDSLAWEKMCAEHSVDSIKDEHLLKKLEDIKKPFY
jgi:hypothetical protein